MKKILLILFLLLNFNAYSMLDSIKGYGGFIFGQTKKEIIEILHSKYITFDTINKNRFLLNKNAIFYKDNIEIERNFFEKDYLQLEITLYFDKFNNNKFYSNDIDIEKYCKDVTVAKEISNKILEIYKEKYGYVYMIRDSMSSKNNFWGRKISYIWNFENGYIVLDFNFGNFYYHIDNDFRTDYTDETEENKKLRITVYYDDKFLSKKYFEKNHEEYEENEKKKKKELEEKF